MAQLRTVAVRVSDELHSQLTLLAKLSQRPLVEEVLEAINEHLARRLSEVDLREEVEKALAQIDAEAGTRRKAIQSLLGDAKSPSSGAKGKGRKSNA